VTPSAAACLSDGQFLSTFGTLLVCKGGAWLLRASMLLKIYKGDEQDFDRAHHL
jgi:hypothetical protein